MSAWLLLLVEVPFVVAIIVLAWARDLYNLVPEFDEDRAQS